MSKLCTSIIRFHFNFLNTGDDWFISFLMLIQLTYLLNKLKKISTLTITFNIALQTKWVVLTDYCLVIE